MTSFNFRKQPCWTPTLVLGASSAFSYAANEGTGTELKIPVIATDKEKTNNLSP